MKLSMKLSIAMGAILVALCCFGIFSLYQMGEINAHTTEISDLNIPNMMASQRMNTLVSDFRRAEVQHVLSSEKDIMAHYAKTMDDVLAEFQKIRKETGARIALPAIRALFNTAMDKWDKYFILHNQMLEISWNQQTAEATAILRGKSKDEFDATSAALLQLASAIKEDADMVSADADRAYANARLITIAILATIMLASLILVFLIVRGVMKQLGKDPGELAVIAGRVTNGDYAIADGSPQIGVYGNIVSMVQALEEQIAKAHAESERASQESENAKAAMMEAEKASGQAQAKTQAMLKAADRLEEVAQVVSSASTQLSAQIEQSGRGAEQQAGMASETATAMEEMNATVLEVAKNAASASEVSAHTRKKAEEGATVVGKAVMSIQQVRQESLNLKEAMSELAQHAQSISQIMGVISDIADQTNLLALNAAIEAARAGDAGRGFAVVADEVRKLAEKTMSSTTDVGNAIKAIQESAGKSMAQVDGAVAIIEETTIYAEESGRALQEIVAMADQTADQVRGIATASEEQSATSEQISSSVNQVNTIAGETARAMEEAAQAVSDLARQAHDLTDLIEGMKQG